MSERVAQKYLEKRHDLISLTLVALHLSFVITPVFWAAWLGPSPALIPLCIWLGASMNGLLNLMHEAAHAHVFKSRAASFRLGHWALAPLVVTDFEVYRKRHWQHHRELGMSGDTKFTYRMDLSPGGLLLFSLRCLLLTEALGKFRHVSAEDVSRENPGEREDARENNHGESSARIPPWLLRGALIHTSLGLILIAIAAWSHGPDPLAVLSSAALAYGFVFLYGLAAVTSFFTAIRSVAEHRAGLKDEMVSGTAALRNLRANPLSRLILSSYGFAEHATHHERPSVPAYHLPALGEELAIDEPRLIPQRGYLATCWLLIHSRR